MVNYYYFERTDPKTGRVFWLAWSTENSSEIGLSYVTDYYLANQLAVDLSKVWPTRVEVRNEQQVIIGSLFYKDGVHVSSVNAEKAA